MINLVLCGGSGTRLWPISRTLYPKQFYKFPLEKYSLFQKTIQRNSSICNKFVVVTNQNHFFMAADQIQNLGMENVSYVLEPIGKNTAPAITLACMALKDEDIVLVTPADHFIETTPRYNEMMQVAYTYAIEDKLVTFGINPTYPETGYGYIQAEGHDVVSFKEKPDYSTALSYLQEKNYYWNSGMFVFKVKAYMDEIKKHSPEIFSLCKNAFDCAGQANDIIQVTLEKMQEIPSISVDYALFEKSKHVKVIPLEVHWSDLGSFESLHKELPKTENGNTCNENVVQVNSHNNLIMTSERTVACIDVDDLIIVDTPDALLVSKQGSSQQVKEIVSSLQNSKPELCSVHTTLYRSWGNYTTLDEAGQYKIKKVIIKPGKKINLQRHYHRNEHWVVVSGTAKVTVNEETFLLRKNEATYISMGNLHMVENPGKIDLILIEVQVGEYVKEEDTETI